MLAIVLLQACTPTRPPLDELDQASRALGAARDAQAATLADEEYRAAGTHFDQAQAAQSTRDYAAAAGLARESIADSELARAKARRSVLRAEVDRLTEENAALSRDLAEHPSPEARP